MDFFSLPYAIVIAGLAAGAAVPACILHALVRRFVPYDDLVAHNDVAGFMISVVGVIYAVLLAFVVVIVWEQYNGSESNYGSEVSAVADVRAFARSLPPADARAARTLTERYIHEMIDDEWPAMRAGGMSDAASATIKDMVNTISAVTPATGVEREARTQTLGALQRVFDLRNRRLADNEETLPPVLWAALIFGAVVTVGFGFLFGVTNVRAQLLMTGAVAALIGVMFALLVELDFPFRRDTAISAARWVELDRYLGATSAAPQQPGSAASHSA